MVSNTKSPVADPSRTLTMGEAYAAISKMESERDKLLFLTLLQSGARIGEVLNLRYYDLDHDNKKLYIHRSKKRTKESVKSPIDVPRLLLDNLKSWGDSFLNYPDSFVFPGGSRHSKHTRAGEVKFFGEDHIGQRNLTKQQAWNILQKAGQAAGIDKRKLHPHGLRHLFAQYILTTKSATAPSRVLIALQKQLGHGSLETTSTYLDFIDDSTMASVVEEAFPSEVQRPAPPPPEDPPSDS